jgi:hexosaminidase
MLFYPLFLTVTITIATLARSVAGSDSLSDIIWPRVAHSDYGSSDVTVKRNVDFVTKVENNGENIDVKTLSVAYERYKRLMFPHATGDASGGNNAGSNSDSDEVVTVQVVVTDLSEAYPQLETDESYELSVSTSGEATISAKTVYGALRALESFSQLVAFDFDKEVYFIQNCPLSIADSPRFPHRGMLLDTSRHFQPLAEIERTIDALSYAKYNVLHWHVVDTQSFPFQSHTYPLLWDGAYTPAERYSQDDIKALVEYGRLRGVKVMIEFDIPGHAASWCAGYPEICPSDTCLQPLDPSSEVTFELIESLLGECTGKSPDQGLFPYSMLHLGGDEVDYRCWQTSPSVQAWAKEHGYTSNEDIYKYFLDRAASIARAQGRTPVQWVEVFEHFGSTLDNNTLVHVWKDKSTLNSVLLAGYKALLSNQNMWYLDWLDTTWQTMYNNEPTDGLSPDADVSLILGGESAMWGETVDASDLDATVWPRAAAVAERLWTPQALMNLETAEERLLAFRCLLTDRGIGAAPLKNTKARQSPSGPGSCFHQRRRLSTD